MTRKRIKRIAFVCYLIALLTIAYGTTVIFRGRAIYGLLKSGRAIRGESTIEADTVLGYAPRPNSSWVKVFQSPPDVLYAYDRDRCRVSGRSEEPSGPFTFLFLGCSFTHGDACPFEETYPSLVSDHFGAKCRNRGFAAYGLSQMVLIAERVIPDTKPTHVFAQYSPWIVDRGMSHFAPTLSTKKPQPFFYSTPDGSVHLHPPPYAACRVRPHVAAYQKTERGVVDKLSFLFNIALPLYINEDIRYSVYRARRALRTIPPPAKDHLSVLSSGYGAIARICKQNGARLIVPVIGAPGQVPREDDLEALRTTLGLELADCWSPLLQGLPDSERATFLSRYAHFRGSPPQMVDNHPNGAAHAIVAQSLIRKLGALLPQQVQENPDHRLEATSPSAPKPQP
ncbi:MAG: hypothetical protein FJ278_07030 [Planctomycetes bacterium]|nr:hypothetical protein [Planctomycetota bacterium]